MRQQSVSKRWAVPSARFLKFDEVCAYDKLLINPDSFMYTNMIESDGDEIEVRDSLEVRANFCNKVMAINEAKSIKLGIKL